MDYKESKTIQFERKNRYHNKIKQEALQLLPHLRSTDTIRDAIQEVKETKRRGLSGESLGRMFQGNSNKYKSNGGESRIMNKVQKRNNQKKQEILQQL